MLLSKEMPDDGSYSVPSSSSIEARSTVNLTPRSSSRAAQVEVVVAPNQRTQLTRNIINLRLIFHSPSQHPPPGRPVPVILAVIQIRRVRLFLLQRKLVEFLSDRELFINELLGDIEADDVEEPFGSEGVD